MKENKRSYSIPEFEIIEFEEKNIIVASDECDPFDDIPCDEGCSMEGIACTPGVG